MHIYISFLAMPLGEVEFSTSNSHLGRADHRLFFGVVVDLYPVVPDPVGVANKHFEVVAPGMGYRPVKRHD